jgi:hypothetical protein
MKRFVTHLWQAGTIGLLCASLAVVPACSLAEFQAVLSEIGSTVTKFAPLLPLVQVAACVVPTDPACGPIGTFVTTATPLATGIGAAFTAWSQASSADQPGKLPQLITAVTVWNNAIKNGLQIPDLSASATAELETELNAGLSLLATLEADLTAGGTTTALADVFRDATPLDATGPLLAFWSPVRLVRTPRSFKLKNGAVVHTWAWHKGILLAKLKLKTSNAAVNNANKSAIEAIKKLG